jgi:putative membrane protein insertion efficiency factor
MSRLLDRLGNGLLFLLRGLLLVLIQIYRYVLSPVLHMLAPGSGCRYTPTCSEYALQAVQQHGPFRGFWLALKRLARCHPWGGFGHDPVPHSCACQPTHHPKHPPTLDPAKPTH